MKMETVSLETHILEAADLIDSAVEQFLTEMGALLSADAAAMSPVDEGQLKGSWDYQVDAAEKSVTVGSNLENAVWNEFGTGSHAANGDGRSSPWYVPVAGYTGSRKPTYKGKVTVGCSILRQTVRRRSIPCNTPQIRICRRRKNAWRHC